MNHIHSAYAFYHTNLPMLWIWLIQTAWKTPHLTRFTSIFCPLSFTFGQLYCWCQISRECGVPFKVCIAFSIIAATASSRFFFISTRSKKTTPNIFCYFVQHVSRWTTWAFKQTMANTSLYIIICNCYTFRILCGSL